VILTARRSGCNCHWLAHVPQSWQRSDVKQVNATKTENAYNNNNNNNIQSNTVGRNTVVSVATGYGLNGPGIESRSGRVFVPVPDRLWGPPSLYAMDTGHFRGLCSRGTGSFAGVMQPGYRVISGGYAAGEPGHFRRLCSRGTGSFSGVMQPGRGVDHRPPSNAKVKEKVELYSNPCGAFMICDALNLKTKYPSSVLLISPQVAYRRTNCVHVYNIRRCLEPLVPFPTLITGLK
jgi:hypothetical protein